MFTVSARTQALTVANISATLGVPMPNDYLERVDRIDLFEAETHQIAASADDLHAAVLTEIVAGRDYWAAENVQRLMLDSLLTSQNFGESARTRVDRRRAKALADYADDILEGWADALEPYAAALAVAATANVDLKDVEGAVARGGDRMHHLHDAQVAVRKWAAAENGFHTLRAVAGIRVGEGPLTLTPACFADLEPAYEMARDERTGGVIDAWILARCALPLKLPSLDEYETRRTAFDDDVAAEARAEADRSKQRVANNW